MLVSMFKSGLTILRHPSIETIQAHMQPNLRWALIYHGLALLVASTVTVLFLPIQEAANAAIMQQLFPSSSEAFISRPTSSILPLWMLWLVSLAFGAFSVLCNYGLLYGIGRALGGAGRFATFAFAFALIAVPITIINIVINLASISFLACLTLPIVLGTSVYFIYLEYLVIRAALELPKDKAIITLLIPFIILFLLTCAIIAAIWIFIALPAVQSMQ
jgi:hypothetical protein